MLDKTWWVWAAFVLVFATFVVLIFMQLQRPDAFPGGAEPPRQAAGDPSGTTGPSEGEEEAPTSDHNIGVWYDAEVRRWAIFNQDLAPMAQGTSFDVHVLSEGGRRSSTRPPPRTPSGTDPTWTPPSPTPTPTPPPPSPRTGTREAS